jgi:hypothetical protein
MITLRRVASWSVILALATALGTARAAEPDRFLPDDTDIVIAVNVRQILDSPLVQKYGLEWLRNFVREKADVQKTLESLGFDPFKDLHTLTVGMPGVADSERAFCVLHGRFDLAKFRAVATDVAKEKAEYLKIHRVGGETLYEVREQFLGDGKPIFVGLVDASTLVACCAKEPILDAFAKAAGKKASSPKKELKQLVAKADGNQSIWLVAPGSPLAGSELTADEKTKKSLEKIEAVIAGLTVTGGIKVDVAVTAKTADAAQELASEINEGLNQAKGLLAVLVGNNAKLSGLVEVLGSVRSTTTGTSTSLSLEVPAAVIDKMLKKE